MMRGMNLLFYGLFFVLLLSFSSAQIAIGSAEDTILRIYSPTNAHGEIYNGAGNYGTPIYYSDLFGTVYSGNPANVHQCVISTPGTNPDNLVLRLSEGSGTNSHAQAPDYSGTAYPTDVCYGDLVCYSRTSDCPSGQAEIVSLSSNTNAHLETAGSNNYNTRICCTASTTPQILDAKWKYFDGTDIPASTTICPNHDLVASVRTAGLANGEVMLIQIFDDDSFSPDPVTPALPVVINNNIAEFVIDLNEPTIRSIFQSELGGTEGNLLELYFDAGAPAIPGSLETSLQIYYSDDPEDCSSEGPIASITAPVHRGIYYSNTAVTFESGCSSQLGPVQNEWTITQNGNTQQLIGQTIPYTFTSAGQANVELKCTDLDGKVDVIENQILVIASPYVLAYINEPTFNEMTYTSPPSSGPYFPTEVSFSASDSFAVDSSGCSVVCLGGVCPIETENSPSSCGGGPITITQTTNSYSPFSFDWTFLDSNWNNDWAPFETGNGIYSGAVQYDDMSNSLDDKKIKVNVRHVATGANAEFERDFTLGRCLNNGNTYYASRTESYSTNQPNSACRGGDSDDLTADDCCAAGLQCLPDEADPSRYFCQIPAGGLILECNDYTTQSTCNGNTNPAIPRASYGQTPNSCTTLSCVWSVSSGTCGLNVTTYQTSSSGSCSSGPGAVVVNSCSYTTTVSECIAGRKTISYNTISGGAICDQLPTTVPCGSLSFELSFFGIRQFLLSILLIGAAYLIFNFRKEIKNGKK